MATEIGSPPRFFHMPRFQHQAPRQLFYKRPDFAQQQAMQQLTFDGKRMRKAVNRKTIDYNPSVIKYLENRVWQRDQRDMRAIQPDAGYYNDLVPPIGMLNNPMNAVTTKFVRTSTNKVKCPVFVVRWTPEGRRLVTGASSGEFTLWNGLTFNFETILQAHDSPVRAMTWSHNDMWMLTADHGGYVKYWQSNMNNVKMFQAHKEAIREASFSPTDNKFATCSDDGTVRIWDFLRCHEERILRGPGKQISRLYTSHLLLWKASNRFRTVLLNALQRNLSALNILCTLLQVCTNHVEEIGIASVQSCQGYKNSSTSMVFQCSV
ncbi:pre-mRNA 3' end processing protein WDR33 isoform X3 [Pyrgilauda ruficollis]|uniref:pre-mRNA 3' end processing protein WDR33 isoform X3 n=1 Tax=Pyrgilauda ruficollis TaxID=221976 RepID=UPI001B87A548|nr:pre-mRNA 3' end processing protein WDR33 isoform X3 [Pyrgilauda ruficollis]